MDPGPALASLLAGALFAWSLAATPGPGNALIAEEASRRGVLAGLLTGLGAIAADFVMFLLMLLGALRILAHVPWAQVVLGAVGCVLLLRFALGAWRSARSEPDLRASGRGGFWKSFVAILTSPLNHVWWTSVGTTFLANTGALAMGGFFGGLLAWVAFWSWLARAGALRVRGLAKGIAYASAAILAVFALVLAAFTTREALALV